MSTFIKRRRKPVNKVGKRSYLVYRENSFFWHKYSMTDSPIKEEVITLANLVALKMS